MDASQYQELGVTASDMRMGDGKRNAKNRMSTGLLVAALSSQAAFGPRRRRCTSVYINKSFVSHFASGYFDIIVDLGLCPRSPENGVVPAAVVAPAAGVVPAAAGPVYA